MLLRQGTPKEAGISSERTRGVIDLAASWVADGLTPALAVLAARRGVIFLHEAFGRLGPEPDSPPFTRDSLFGIASISKSLTATAVMLLVEDGRIGLNRPVQEYIPEFAGEGKEAIWVRHLLTHTSGLRDEDLALEEATGDKVELPPLEPTQHPLMHKRLQLAYRMPVWRLPDTQFHYSSVGYDLLGEIVRRVSGKSFSDFARERIFLPLGMKDTFFSVPGALRGRILKYHISPFGWDNVECPMPSSTAFSTALDLARFGQTFLNRGCYGDVRLLSPATVAAMTCNQIPGIPRELPDGEIAPAPGFGWFLFREAKLRGLASLWSPQSYSHTGGSGAVLWVDPVYDLVGVFLFTKIQENVWPQDLFINAVTAAIKDE
jgi:CubicO group peptidase (beta-lactamase class C family)